MLFFHIREYCVKPLQWLSLDVALGACAGMYFFAHLLGLQLNWGFYFLMALAVWGIYTLDHLLDVRGLKKIAQTKRHAFHQRYFKTILVCLIVAVFMAFGVAFVWEPMHDFLLPGLALAFVIVFWMLMIRKLLPKAVWLKEFSIALFYVMGIALVPFLEADRELIQISICFFGMGYVLVAWLNLLILSYQDRDSDEKDGFGSILSLLSKGHLEVLIIGLGVFSAIYFVALLLLLPSYFHIYSGILLLILLFHIIQFLGANPNPELIRRRLELSFLLPFLLLLFN